MKVTPVSFSGKYYDFSKKDPRKEYPGFRLGMPNDEFVELKNIGDFSYLVTAGMVREGYIKAYYPDYRNNISENTVVGEDQTHYGLKYDVTAGNVRDEILREEKAQEKLETPPFYVDFDNFRG